MASRSQLPLEILRSACRSRDPKGNLSFQARSANFELPVSADRDILLAHHLKALGAGAVLGAPALQVPLPPQAGSAWLALGSQVDWSFSDVRETSGNRYFRGLKRNNPSLFTGGCSPK